MKHTIRSGNVLNRLLKLLVLITLLVGLFWLPGSSLFPGHIAEVKAAGDPVIAAAGDIACDPANANFKAGNGTATSCRQKYTSDLMVNAGLAAVLDLGDNQYYCGGYQAYLNSYDLSWGRLKSITHPSVGNHEYLTSGGTGCDTTNAGAAGYFQYFGAAAGNPGQGYYSFDIGSWHLIALNSNCTSAGGCGATSAQGKWLEADLTAHANDCVLAYWHIPLFSSGGRANSNSKPFWTALYNHNADLILVGHDHIYERFAPQTPAGVADPVRGIRQIMVGTGGADHTSITTIAANSELRNVDTFGVLMLTLHPTSFDWQFVPEAGKTFTDSGTGTCHTSAADTTPPTAPAALTASAAVYNQVNLGWTASTDDFGVTGYRIFRDGTQIATPSGTSTTFVDTTVQAHTTYNYYAIAVDGAGNTSAPSNTAPVTTPAAPATPTPTAVPTVSAVLTFNPSDDTYVQSDQPTTTFGTSTQIVVDNSPARNILLKFTVSGIGTKTVTSAKLRLFCVNASPYGGDFHMVADSTWSEGTVNWNNAPPADPGSLGILGKVVVGTWYEVDVTALVTGDGTFSVKGISTNADGAYYSSKEGTNPPQLVIATTP